jgi:hypothetical protein
VTIPRSISVLALIAAFAGLSQAQPAGKPASTTKKPSAKAVTSGARSRTSGSPSAQTDVQIEKAIRERFADSKIAEDKFEVHVQGGPRDSHREYQCAAAQRGGYPAGAGAGCDRSHQ